MVNIISQYAETSTDTVLDYLKWLGSDFKRINEEDTIKGVSIEIGDDSENVVINYDLERKVHLHEFQNAWYRKGDYSMALPAKRKEINNDFVEKFLMDEWGFIKNFLHKSSKSLGGFSFEIENNKLLNLKYAKQAGLNIPTTLVTTNKSELVTFIQKHKKVITKPIHNAHVGYKYEGNHIVSKGTQTIEMGHLEGLEAIFCPLLAQEYTEKEIELRVFFLGNVLYTMAIFSQLDEKTKLDYRNYNAEKPNRNVPYQFSQKEEKCIIEFIKLSSLNTGSIDLILTKEGKIVFLEVNPTGQFGWVSETCNYYIEEAIARYLLNKNNFN